MIIATSKFLFHSYALTKDEENIASVLVQNTLKTIVTFNNEEYDFWSEFRK